MHDTLDRPLGGRRRIEALDVLRGLAIFGIVVVNVGQLFQPFALATEPVGVVPGERGVWPAWLLVDAFFDLKFVTLFSLLFGIGFALQARRADRDPATFRRMFTRRLAALAAFGLAHALLFYFADVLVIYALAGAALLLCHRWPARRLLLAGGILLALTMVVQGITSGGEDPGRLAELESFAAALSELPEGTFQLGDETRPWPPTPAEARAALDRGSVSMEVYGYTRGPWWLTVMVRAAAFELVMIYTVFYFGWRTLALFLLGAAVVRYGGFEPARTAAWRRVARIGLGLGLPLSLAATAARAAGYAEPATWTRPGAVGHDLSSVLIAFGMIGAVVCWTAAGEPGRLRRGLAAVGRTALSNYLGQSAVLSLVACWYGLGLFGRLARVEQLALAAAVFAMQSAASALWLRRYRMGPLEWLWRMVTYRRRLPLRAA